MGNSRLSQPTVNARGPSSGETADKESHLRTPLKEPHLVEVSSKGERRNRKRAHLSARSLVAWKVPFRRSEDIPEWSALCGPPPLPRNISSSLSLSIPVCLTSLFFRRRLCFLLLSLFYLFPLVVRFSSAHALAFPKGEGWEAR